MLWWKLLNMPAMPNLSPTRRSIWRRLSSNFWSRSLNAVSLSDNTQATGLPVSQSFWMLIRRSWSFKGRMVGLDSIKKIEDFQQSLDTLITALDSGNIIYSAFVSARMSNKIDTLCKHNFPLIANIFWNLECSSTSITQPYPRGRVWSSCMPSGYSSRDTEWYQCLAVIGIEPKHYLVKRCRWVGQEHH